jgi:hypothetical protein
MSPYKNPPVAVAMMVVAAAVAAVAAVLRLVIPNLLTMALPPFRT